MSAQALVLIVALSIVLGLVVGALLLRIACSICRAELPGFFKAIGVAFIVGFLGVIAGSAVGFVLGAVGYIAGIPSAAVQVVSLIVGLPVNMLLSALLYKVLLATTFKKGVLIWLVHLLFTVLLLGTLILIMTLLETYADW